MKVQEILSEGKQVEAYSVSIKDNKGEQVVRSTWAKSLEDAMKKAARLMYELMEPYGGDLYNIEGGDELLHLQQQVARGDFEPSEGIIPFTFDQKRLVLRIEKRLAPHLPGHPVLGQDPIEEAAKRAFKRYGMEVLPYFRCTSGKKKGKLVKDPSQCGMRKDPKKVRQGRKNARMNKAIRVRKSSLAKKTSMSKVVRRMNQRLG